VAGPETTGAKQRGGAFSPGVSGNPSGRPKGARNKATLAAEALLDGQAAALTQRAIDAAMTGDATALRLCLDRIVPPRRDRPVSFPMAPMKSAADAAAAMASLIEAVAHGELTPGEASEVTKILEAYTRSLELCEFERRLSALEGKAEQ